MSTSESCSFYGLIETNDQIWSVSSSCFVKNEKQFVKVCRRDRGEILFSSAWTPHHIGPDDQAILKGAMLIDERTLSGSQLRGVRGPRWPRACAARRATSSARRTLPNALRPTISFLLPEPGDTPVITRLRAGACAELRARRARWCPSGAVPAPQKPCHSVAGPLARRFGPPEQPCRLRAHRAGAAATPALRSDSRAPAHPPAHAESHPNKKHHGDHRHHQAPGDFHARGPRGRVQGHHGQALRG